INTALRDVGPRRRILLCGDDAGLAALVSRLLRTENLDVEVAYVTGDPTPCTVAYGLPPAPRPPGWGSTARPRRSRSSGTRPARSSWARPPPPGPATAPWWARPTPTTRACSPVRSSGSPSS